MYRLHVSLSERRGKVCPTRAVWFGWFASPRGEAAMWVVAIAWRGHELRRYHVEIPLRAVLAAYSVRHLKGLIAKAIAEGCRPEDFRLEFRGRVLHDTAVLTYYGITGDRGMHEVFVCWLDDASGSDDYDDGDDAGGGGKASKACAAAEQAGLPPRPRPPWETGAAAAAAAAAAETAPLSDSSGSNDNDDAMWRDVRGVRLWQQRRREPLQIPEACDRGGLEAAGSAAASSSYLPAAAAAAAAAETPPRQESPTPQHPEVCDRGGLEAAGSAAASSNYLPAAAATAAAAETPLRQESPTPQHPPAPGREAAARACMPPTPDLAAPWKCPKCSTMVRHFRYRCWNLNCRWKDWDRAAAMHRRSVRTHRPRGTRSPSRRGPGDRREHFHCLFTTDRVASSEYRPKCVVCMDKDAVFACVPCGHLVRCTECAAPFPCCPLCRAPINTMLRVWFT